MTAPLYLYRLFRIRQGTFGYSRLKKPEERLQYEVANMLRAASLDGTLRAVWTHPANEGISRKQFGVKLKALGRLSGAPDLWFVWTGGGGMIELKVGPKIRPSSLTDNQKDVQQWAVERGVNHAVCTSAEEVWRVLVRWGAASDETLKRSA